MAATGRHPKKGKWPEKDIRLGCVAMKQEYLSFIYRSLFKPGIFQIFFHPVLFRWCVVEKNNPDHQKYEDLWINAPPVIPERYVVSVAWEAANKEIPVHVNLVNGGQIRFFSAQSVSGPPRSEPYDGFWIDEELDDFWLAELRTRLVDRNGRLIWSTTPHRAVEEFRRMEGRAEEPDQKDKPPSKQTGYFKLFSRDNKYISQVGLEALEDKLLDDPEQLKVRIHGEFPFDIMAMYPDFRESENVIEPFPKRWEDTVYIIIDPGTAEAGVLFCFVPSPPTEKMLENISEDEEAVRTKEGAIVVFDELLLQNANAQVIAQQIKLKLSQHPASWIQDFMIDERAGKQTGIGMRGMQPTVAEVFWKCLMAEGLNARDEGFKYGTSDMNFGIAVVKSYLLPDRDDYLPKLFIFDNCVKTIHQLKYWRKKTTGKGKITGYDERNKTLPDCLRYACTRGLEYVAPPEIKPSDRTLTELRKAMSQNFNAAAMFGRGR